MPTGTAKLDLLLADGQAVANSVDLRTLDHKQLVLSGASGLIGTSVLSSLAAARLHGARFDLALLLRSEPEDELADLVRLCGASVVRADLADPCFDPGPGADVTIHAAGPSAPMQFTKRPLETLAIGAGATLRLLKAIVPGGRFLFLSSTEVYSGLDGRVATECDIGTTTPMHPRACYIEAKRAGETACVAARSAGINAVVARVGTTYGPGTRAGDTRVLNQIIEQALGRGRVELLDGGESVRTLCYVTDTVELLWHAVLDGRSPAYNIAGPQEITILELARSVCELTDAELVASPYAASVPGAPRATRIDISRATKEFGKADWVSIRDGLARTVAWQELLHSAGPRQ